MVFPSLAYDMFNACPEELKNFPVSGMEAGYPDLEGFSLIYIACLFELKVDEQTAIVFFLYNIYQSIGLMFIPR